MDIIGHSKIVNFIENSTKYGQMSHAYLFIGPQSVGKFSLAQMISHSMLCQGKGNDTLLGGKTKNFLDTCNNCPGCEALTNNVHPDFSIVTVLDKKSVISIEQVRNSITGVYRKPIYGKYKFLIIDDAHNMTTSASNALLKTLEEPPLSSIIFLITHRPDALPTTILSRCQMVEFDKVTDFIPDEDDQKLWIMSKGLPGIFFTMKTNKKYLNNYLEEINSFSKICEATKGERLYLVSRWFKKSKIVYQSIDEWENRLKLWQNILRDILITQLDASIDAQYKNYLPNITLSPFQVVNLIDTINTIKTKLDQNINIRMQVESFCILMP